MTVAAATGAPVAPLLRPIVDRIRPSLPADVGNADLAEVSATHVRRTVEQLTSDVAGAVVGMTYRLAEGRVTVVT